MDKKQEIRLLYNKVVNKTTFIIHLAEVLGKEPTSIQTNWFSRFWAVPNSLQDDVIRELKNWNKKQTVKVN